MCKCHHCVIFIRNRTPPPRRCCCFSSSLQLRQRASKRTSERATRLCFVCYQMLCITCTIQLLLCVCVSLSHSHTVTLSFSCFSLCDDISPVERNDTHNLKCRCYTAIGYQMNIHCRLFHGIMNVFQQSKFVFIIILFCLALHDGTFYTIWIPKEKHLQILIGGWFLWRCHAVAIWISLSKLLNQLRVDQANTIQLIAKCYPERVWTPMNFCFLSMQEKKK